jgi:hypothetical protein
MSSTSRSARDACRGHRAVRGRGLPHPVHWQTRARLTGMVQAAPRSKLFFTEVNFARWVKAEL